MSNLNGQGPSRVKVKICGITNLHDARVAANAGADYLGYILYERSPRFVSGDVIRGITSTIRTEFPHIQHVGVFVNEDAETLCETMAAAALDLAQLHGGETAMYCASLAERGHRYMRAMRFGAGAPLTNWIDFPGAHFYLCDTYDPVEAGGTGKAFDHSLLPHGLPLDRAFLAGGLNADNVAAAIAEVRPHAVDVSSGVEEAPGKKSPQKIAAFLDAVRGANSIHHT